MPAVQVGNILFVFTALILSVFLCYVDGKAFKMDSDPLNDLRIIRKCNQSSPVDLGVLNSILINKHTIGDDSKKFNCFLHCLYKNYGFMNEDGGFDTDYMIQILSDIPVDKPFAETLVYKCTAVNSYDKCDRAMQFTKCFWKETLYQESPDHEDYTDSENYYYNA